LVGGWYFAVKPPKRYTGKNLSPAKSAQILGLLCSGLGVNQVAKRTNTQWLTVRAVQWANIDKVEERKRILAERSEHAAADALDILHDKLKRDGHKLRTAELVPAYGVLIDKSIALRADPTIHIEHSHQHIHAHISDASYQQLLSKLPRRNPPSSLPALTPTDAPMDASSLNPLGETKNGDASFLPSA
jgi:hypothetical protein